MGRIVHIALKVDDLDAAARFYRDVFGLAEVKRERTRDHVSLHLSDGVIDLALLAYEAGAASAEARAAGDGPCIHHFGVEVSDPEQAAAHVRALGCEIISEPGVVPVKFRAPGGGVCEIVPEGRYRKAAGGGS